MASSVPRARPLRPSSAFGQEMPPCSMKLCLQALFCLSLSFSSIEGAEPVWLLKAVPTAGELGEGWRQKDVRVSVDRLFPAADTGSEPDVQIERKKIGGTDQEAFLSVEFRYQQKPLRPHGPFADSMVMVSVERWFSAESSSQQQRRESTSPTAGKNAAAGRTPPAIGQGAFWSGTMSTIMLTCQVDQYRIKVTSGSMNEQGILRMARVIKAKLGGRAIPEDSPTEGGTKNLEPHPVR